jgi:hypothetical protein
MFAIISQALAISLAVATPATSTIAATPATTVSAESCDFGEIYSFHAGQCQIAFYNASDKPVRVLDIQSTKIGSSVEPNTIVVPSHARVYITAKIQANDEVGNKRYPFRFSTDEKGQEPRLVSASGFILNALDEVRSEIDFGVVELNSKLPSKNFALSSRETPNFRITKVLETPTWVDASISSDGRSVETRVRSSATWGLNSGFIKLEIDTPRQNQAWIQVKADVHGDVVPNANPLDMGLMHIGNDNEYLIRLTSRSGNDFKIGKVELEGAKGDVSARPCIPAVRGCRMIRLVVSDKQHTGAIKGNIIVDLPEFGRKLPVTVWGLLFPKNVKLEKYDDEKAAANVRGESQSPAGKKPLELANALKKITSNNSQVDMPPPAGSGPLLKWKIANGTSVYGFQIFRADAESGPFVLINPSPVRAAPTDDTLSYQWRDMAAVSGRTYWYYVGVVKLTGEKQQLTGAQKTVAK